jgi:hypothetical protein
MKACGEERRVVDDVSFTLWREVRNWPFRPAVSLHLLSMYLNTSHAETLLEFTVSVGFIPTATQLGYSAGLVLLVPKAQIDLDRSMSAGLLSLIENIHFR